MWLTWGHRGVTLGGAVSFCSRNRTTQFSFPVAGSALSRWFPVISWYRICLTYRELLHLRSQSSRSSFQMAEQDGGIKVQLFWPKMELFDRQYLFREPFLVVRPALQFDFFLFSVLLLLPFHHRYWFLISILYPKLPLSFCFQRMQPMILWLRAVCGGGLGCELLA